ncbi:MAG TPA: Fic family protein, partial [Tepidisphaeraceae bacterium]|nr:Fic family protein [Tepidisphaeraceae bacterium]
MERRDFHSRSPGMLIKNALGQLTYVPKPLPPSYRVSAETHKRVNEVSTLLGRLDGMARSLPDPKILIRSFIRREAQLSSYIENTYASYDELGSADRANVEDVAAEVRETLNAERAITAGVEAVFVKHQPVSLAMIRAMHELLLAGVRGHETRGRFRKRQVYIGSSTAGVAGARYVPPPPTHVDELMRQLLSYIRADDGFPVLVRLAMQHYQFEAIHPFEDGNGRLGRILILLGLCQHQLLSVPVLNPSLYFERSRRDYYDGLLAVSTHGDWAGWVDYFIEGLRIAATESAEKLNELRELRGRYHNVVRTARNSAAMLNLVDQLFVTPSVTIPQTAQIMKVTWPTARAAIDKLVSLHILREKSAVRPSVYVADEI